MVVRTAPQGPSSIGAFGQECAQGGGIFHDPSTRPSLMPGTGLDQNATGKVIFGTVDFADLGLNPTKMVGPNLE